MAVKQQIADELFDWQGTGCSVMEVSHRSPEFVNLAEHTEQLARELIGISDDYAVMFIQGGARTQYAMLPMNLSSPQGQAVYAVNGHWGKLALKEGGRFTQAITTAPVSETTYASIPDYEADEIPQTANYFHYTSNETLEGVQWSKPPECGAVPLCCDMTSDLLSREFDMNRHAMIYASAQKNMGIAGITFVALRKDLIGQSANLIPMMNDYQTYANSGSMYNTPPTFPWYVMNLVLQWVKGQGGLAGIQRINRQKSGLLYEYVDRSDFYQNMVSKNCRSEVNVPFWLADESLNQAFLDNSAAAGLKALKGHKAVGGMRASIYNAIPEAGIEALISFMQEFERTHG